MLVIQQKCQHTTIHSSKPWEATQNFNIILQSLRRKTRILPLEDFATFRIYLNPKADNSNTMQYNRMVQPKLLCPLCSRKRILRISADFEFKGPNFISLPSHHGSKNIPWYVLQADWDTALRDGLFLLVNDNNCLPYWLGHDTHLMMLQ